MNTVTLVLLFLSRVLGYPGNLACTTALSSTSSIHGTSIGSVGSSTFSVTVKTSGGQTVSTGSTYVPGGTYTLSIADIGSSDYILEVLPTTTHFVTGGKTGCLNRKVDSSGNIVMPTGGQTVTIKAGTAPNKSQVKLTTLFTLYAPVAVPSAQVLSTINVYEYLHFL